MLFLGEVELFVLNLVHLQLLQLYIATNTEGKSIFQGLYCQTRLRGEDMMWSNFPPTLFSILTCIYPFAFYYFLQANRSGQRQRFTWCSEIAKKNASSACSCSFACTRGVGSIHCALWTWLTSVHPADKCISAVLQVPMVPPGRRALLSSGKAAECLEQEAALPVLPV